MSKCTLLGVCLLVTCSYATSAHAQPPGAYLGELSWTEAEVRLRETPIVVIPFGGGAKEHGPHLPMNADQKVMEYLCHQAIDALDVLVAPPILHGWFPAFRGFPGTEVADPEVFEKYVFEVAMSLVHHDVQRIVFLNTGISKATGLPISIAAREIRTQTGTPTLVVSWDDLETAEVAALGSGAADGHAGEMETSINLYIQPELVHLERAEADFGHRTPQDYPGYRPGRLARDPADPGFTETGLVGDPTLASPEKGRGALEIMTREWIKALQGFSRVATGDPAR